MRLASSIRLLRGGSTATFTQTCYYSSHATPPFPHSVIKRALDEQSTAHKAPSLSIPRSSPPSPSSKRNPPRSSDLYDALINQRNRVSRVADNVATEDPYANPDDTLSRSLHSMTNPLSKATHLSLKENAALHKRLSTAATSGEFKQAAAVINEIVSSGRVPSPNAILLATEACIRAGALTQAISLQEKYLAPPTSDVVPVCASRSSRAVLALAFSVRSEHEKALEVLHIRDWQEFSNLDRSRLATALIQKGLGRDSLCWGVVLKALSNLTSPRLAVSACEIAMQQSVGVSDGLLHVMIDVLRRAGMWREAVALFDEALDKGVSPKERTIASVMLALTGKQARGDAEASKVEELVDMAEHPSPRFMSVSLMALSAVGSMERAERIFFEIEEESENGTPDEFCFGCMMATYGNFVSLLKEDVDEKQRREIYEAVNKKVDELWVKYMRAYRLQRPSGGKRLDRELMLSKYLLAKTRCFKAEEAVTAIEEVAEKKEMYPWLEIRTFHVTAVMGSLELSSDVGRIERLMKVLEKVGLQHDMRSLAFCIGGYIGDGNLGQALKLVRRECSRLIGGEALEGGFKNYYPAMLLRRLRMLADGLNDAGVGKVPDLEAMIASMDRIVRSSRGPRGRPEGKSHGVVKI